MIVIATAFGAGCGEQREDTGGLSCSESAYTDAGRTQALSVSHGHLAADPERLTISSASLGAEATATVVLTNDGRDVLHITDIELVEEEGAAFDRDRELFRGERGWGAYPVVLLPGESYEVEVRFDPVNIQEDRGALVVHTACTNGQTLEVPIETPRLEPDLFVPRTVAFGRVPYEDDPDWRGEWKLVPVQNIGRSLLRIDDVYISGSNSFRVTIPQPTPHEREHNQVPDPSNDVDQWPEALAAGDSFSVRVWFRPPDNLPQTGELVFETDDADEPTYVTELSAQHGTPCINVIPDNELRFDDTPVGEATTETLVVENCSRTQPLELSTLQLTETYGDVFSLEGSDIPMLAPAQHASVEVVFRPRYKEAYETEVTIESNDLANGELRVPVVGKGIGECPQAVAKGGVVGTSRLSDNVTTIPMFTVRFDGSHSHDLDGSVERYEWTILSKPQDSVQRLLPDASAANPRLFLDRPGIYQVELKVYDDDGLASCGERAIVTIDATPNEDVLVQLVWNTPNDPDQTDEVGTDLDLHYLHPNGEWDEPSLDIFWRNPTADWGVQWNRYDDPRLDIDDTDGLGPEHIRHSRLQNRTYRTGVYYKDDAGFGSSFATVRIYVRGQLEYEQVRELSGIDKFWDVATITWPSAQVRTVGRVYTGFPQRP